MPSLKDIGITDHQRQVDAQDHQAMQMVAAAKLRRAQDRPRPPGRMPSAWGGAGQSRRRRRRSPARRAARRHRQGRGPPPGRRHLRSRPLRRLQLLDRPRRPRARIQELLGPRQDRSRSSPSARRAASSSAATSPAAWSSHVDGIAASGGRLRRRAARSRATCWHRYTAGEFDVCTIFYNQLQVGDLADPDLPAADPVGGFEAAAIGEPAAPSTNTSRTRRRSSASLLPRNRRRRSSPRCSRTPPRAGRAHDRDGQRHPQRRRDDRQADHHLQPLAAGRRSPRN